jgi:hypothetical protein
LGAELADYLKIPFFPSRPITQEILERDQYDFSSGIQVERFLAAADRQSEILKKTINQQMDVDQFVTDRTFVDLAAYAICELHDDDTSTLQKLYDACK